MSACARRPHSAIKPSPLLRIDVNILQVFYHFSIMRKDTNAPNSARLHKYAFFEAGFSEMNSGWTEAANETSNPTLRWAREHVSVWEAEWDADVWHNIAYEVDFGAKTVGFWQSTGSDDLALAVAPVLANSTYSMGADWHVGHLELPRDGELDELEDVFFSGVYIESDSLTKAIAG